MFTFGYVGLRHRLITSIRIDEVIIAFNNVFFMYIRMTIMYDTNFFLSL